MLTIPCRQAEENVMKNFDETIIKERNVKQDGVVRAVYKGGGWIIRPVGEDQSDVTYMGSVYVFFERFQTFQSC